MDINDLLLQLSHVCSFEWHCAEEHGIEDDTSTPNIWLEAAIAFAFENFWGDVGGGTTLLMLQLILALYKFTNSKVADFDVTLTCKQNVI